MGVEDLEERMEEKEKTMKEKNAVSADIKKEPEQLCSKMGGT